MNTFYIFVGCMILFIFYVFFVFYRNIFKLKYFVEPEIKKIKPNNKNIYVYIASPYTYPKGREDKMLLNHLKHLIN